MPPPTPPSPKASTTSSSPSAPLQRIPLGETALLVNAPEELRVGSELALELESADEVDLLCSFVKWSGYVRLKDSLTRYLRDQRRPLRVITTAYMGATERRALDELCKLGAQVRISYDTRRTRLHAKAWLFRRNSGLSTAYIGSSNLSAAALTDGLEWNVRVAAAETPRVLEKFAAAFEGYWADPEFEAYDPAVDGKRLDEALKLEGDPLRLSELVTFDVRPYPHQQEILERLEQERVAHGRHRNLVVAATGTGKTLIAAFDYARLGADRPSLLFVAHRQEILEQTLTVFRHVLRDRTFGELFVGGARPAVGRHVFASVQSLAKVELEGLPRDAYRVVVIDEFHHARAPTYQRLLQHFAPEELLGLTATPERSDGTSVAQLFDGRIAAEVRLWEAIDRGLLCPFQYFGVRDTVDLDAITWKRGYVPAELSSVYTGDEARVKLVQDVIEERVAHPRRMRCLAFCVSVAHAEFMAEALTKRGLPAAAVTGEHEVYERTGLQQLRERKVNVLCTVDVFNEGIDLPWVDTILMLRPTESATVFLQQLGRGLRLAPGEKDCLTVLDFIGRPHERFRFEGRFRALVPSTREGLARELEEGFPRLPSGCSIQLQREAMELVLENVRSSLGSSRPHLEAELRRIGDVDLATFLREAGLSVAALYRGGRTFTGLRRAVGLERSTAPEGEADLGEALERLVHLDDPGRIGRIRTLLDGGKLPGERGQRERLMLGGAVIGRNGPGELDAWLAALRKAKVLRGELDQLLAVLAEDAPYLARPMPVLPSVPLQQHCRYNLVEILAAFGALAKGGKSIQQPLTGVHFDRETKADLLFVTLEKGEKQYSATTRYRDYPVSPTEFHWESQNTATPESKAGRRHVRHEELRVTPLLFVRTRKKAPGGATVPYTFLGPVRYLRHTGAKPMQIVWRLGTAMPAELFQELKLAAG